MREMKGSDIEWLGNIPANWDIHSLKRVLSTPITDGPHETPILYDEGIPFVSAESVKGGVINLDYKRGYISLEDHERFQRKVSPKKGDIFIVKSGATTGNIGLVITDQVFDIWSPLALVRGDSSIVEQEFLYYQLLSNIFRVQVEQGWSYGTQQNISMKALGTIKVMVPPLDEQKTIIKYLHNKCTQIDTIIAKEQSVIEKLQEYKQSIITETITKGLDSTINMKYSGFKWLGNIPINCSIHSLKKVLLTPITDGPHETPTLYDEGIPFVSAESVKGGIINLDYKRGYISLKDHERFQKKVSPRKGDIFIVKSGVTTGNIGIVTTDQVFDIWSPLALVRGDSSIVEQDFLYYQLLSNIFRVQVEQGWSYGTQQNIGMKVLGNIKVLIPPLESQKNIVKYLDNKCSNMDTVILKKQALIDKLTEYKKSLIYEVVTGKKEVPHV